MFDAFKLMINEFYNPKPSKRIGIMGWRPSSKVSEKSCTSKPVNPRREPSLFL